jgi:hypothetical protein
MPYATDRRGFSRTGFRPALTDTFAAAQGLGRTPFDPERLGQVHPFPPGAGYHLRGLGDIVPNGAIIQYTGTWATSISEQADSILAQVVAALGADGFHVVSSSQSGGLLGTLFTGSFTATIQLQVANGMGFAQPSDIAAIVDHEAFVATGIMPSGSSAGVVSVPGSAPGLLPGNGTDWNTWIQQNALWLGLGVLGLVLLPDLLERF